MPTILIITPTQTQDTGLQATVGYPPVAQPAEETADLPLLAAAIAALTPTQAVGVLDSLFPEAGGHDADIAKDILYDHLAVLAYLQGTPAALDDLKNHQPKA